MATLSDAFRKDLAKWRETDEGKAWLQYLKERNLVSILNAPQDTSVFAWPYNADDNQSYGHYDSLNIPEDHKFVEADSTRTSIRVLRQDIVESICWAIWEDYRSNLNSDGVARMMMRVVVRQELFKEQK
jgi:hypothetical protein